MLTQKQALSFFHYLDGQLIRTSVASKKNKIGDVAGSLSKRGYLYVSFYNKKLYVHRIIWLMCHGTLPKFIDHIDGNKLNNRIENLRICNKSENACNSKLRSDSTSGIKGVSWFKPRQKWRARINFNKKEYHIGYFDSKDAAEYAVTLARKNIHQKFARNA